MRKSDEFLKPKIELRPISAEISVDCYKRLEVMAEKKESSKKEILEAAINFMYEDQTKKN